MEEGFVIDWKTLYDTAIDELHSVTEQLVITKAQLKAVSKQADPEAISPEISD